MTSVDPASERSRAWSGRGLLDRLDEALVLAGHRLEALRTPGAAWEGFLSSSALSTATAVFALESLNAASSARDSKLDLLIERGLRWLMGHANSDGGWGDTVDSPSNLSTTTLVWAALRRTSASLHLEAGECISAAEAWLVRKAGGLDPERLSVAILARYGRDRTFSVPILTMAALAGCLGPEPAAWRHVIPLPFELAVLPRRWFSALRLPVVSYALPALIAIGLARHRRSPSRFPWVRWIRNLATKRALGVLQEIQPVNGGFLEATPLTSFVLMSLVGCGLSSGVVAQRAADFLSNSIRKDGSWPIDTNLRLWVSTLAVNALGMRIWMKPPHPIPPPVDRRYLLQWLLRSQFRTLHSYTQAKPGGWAWTDLPGGVPDADDTAGAIIALRHLDPAGEEARAAASAGMDWLLGLQNSDGGIPTFCKGWGSLPFDRSSPDITAHALRAWLAWSDGFSTARRRLIERAIRKALNFLGKSQQADGSWIPLWFGNHHLRDETNPIYGTSRVLLALSLLDHREFSEVPAMIDRAISWMISVRNLDGGWGGGMGAPSSLEETALAVESIAAGIVALGVAREPASLHSNSEVPRSNHLRIQLRPGMRLPAEDAALGAVRNGAAWLIDPVRWSKAQNPSPIGFYFAKLWYAEAAYPVVFSMAALHQVKLLSEAMSESRFLGID